jgi:predicted nucleotidyltransferase
MVGHLRAVRLREEYRVVDVGEASALAAAEELADCLAEVIGTGLRSVILHGSLATGDFRPGRSDIDLLAIIAGGLSDPQIQALADRVRRAEVGSAAGIDVHIVTVEVAGTPTPIPPLELHIGRYDRSSAEIEVERRVSAAADLPAELSMARATGRALKGLQPRAVIAPVPPKWSIERGRYWLMKWRSLTDDAEHAAFMVLTACRIWRFAVDGVHCSKSQAGRWALDKDPSLTAVRQALHQYETDPTTPIDEEGIAHVLDTVLHETLRQ